MTETQKMPCRESDFLNDRSGISGFRHRKLVRSLLESPDFERNLISKDLLPEKIINPLLSFLFETDEVIRWRAIRAVGVTVSAICRKAVEPARVIMRRLIWSLNDESGGIGWGSPEAMGEIMAEDETLAREYHRILISFIDENGNLLENPELERGVLWGINRLAQKRPELLNSWTGPILKQLSSHDPMKRGLAILILLLLVRSVNGEIGFDRFTPGLLSSLKDESKIRIYQDGSFIEHKISRIASELIDSLTGSP